jgi:hypothetical protein
MRTVHGAQQAYSNNLVDHHLILDLLPGLAAAFFAGHLPASMSLAQAAILLAMVTRGPPQLPTLAPCQTSASLHTMPSSLNVHMVESGKLPAWRAQAYRLLLALEGVKVTASLPRVCFDPPSTAH